MESVAWLKVLKPLTYVRRITESGGIHVNGIAI